MKSKVAALYTAFNGLELLEKSIEQIVDYVDVVVIAYQNVSNLGEWSHEVEPFVKGLESEKIHVLEFEPNLNRTTKQNERAKLQMRIDYARSIGCTHFFSSATDHFYNSEHFGRAVTHSIINDYDVTFTRMFTYYKHPTWQIDPIEDYFMPFICKIHPNTKVEYQKNYPVKVDPSIMLNTCKKYHVFPIGKIMMHHFSMVRVDIENKFRNAAASIRWNDEQKERFLKEWKGYDIESNPGVSYFRGRKVKVVPNHFGL